jgi:hypothetical protein
MKIYKINEIFERFETCIKERKGFSHIRFGDGGIKFLHCLLYDDKRQRQIIVKKEGLPDDNSIIDIFDRWGYYARHADFIDTPEVYFTNAFWPRLRSTQKTMTDKTEERMRMWSDLYRRAEFDNENYCNPESNYLMILKRAAYKNLLYYMRNYSFAIITAQPDIKKTLNERGFHKFEIFEIVGHYQNQYKNSYKKMMSEITDHAPEFDFWLVAAGELGRLYSGHIKECGGRCLDIGFVIEFWLGEDIHPRLQLFMKRSSRNPLELEYTTEGCHYDQFI